MAKAKGESWLTTAFYEGVNYYALTDRPRPAAPYKGALGRCWLAQHDPRRRACVGPFERFHFLRREDVEEAVRSVFAGGALVEEPCGLCADGIVDGAYPCTACERRGTWRAPMLAVEVDAVVLLAAWDPRNAEIGCEGHHRRFDHHLTPPLPIHHDQLPSRVVEFADYWALDDQFNARFPSRFDQPVPSPTT